MRARLAAALPDPMCGRTRCTLSDEDIVSAVIGPPSASGEEQQQQPRAHLAWPQKKNYRPLHNMGPARATPAVTGVRDGGDDPTSSPTIVIESMVWGVPRGGGGAASPHSSPSSSSTILVNGRAETVFATPTWARALAAGPEGRAVVLANGYYEWKRHASGSTAPAQPHYVARADGTPLALAALVTPPPPGSAAAGAHHPPCRRYAVLTTSPPKALAWLHDRAPLLLPTPEAVRAWLSVECGPTPASLKALSCASAVEAWPTLTAHPVKLEVGNVRYQAADCSLDVRQRKGSLGSLFERQAAAGAAKRVKVEGGGGGQGDQVDKKQGVKKQKRMLDAFVVKKDIGGGGGH